jgi:hypothetical protein
MSVASGPLVDLVPEIKTFGVGTPGIHARHYGQVAR